MSLSNDMEDWTEDKCIQLIREFRKRPFLWDQKHRAYYKKELKPVAWDEIAEIVGMSEFCCRHKLGILMSSFRREKAKAINSRRTGDPAKYYYSSWFGFKYMAFLLDKKAESERQSRIEQGLEEDDSDEPDEVEIKLMPDDDVELFEEGDNYDSLQETNAPSPEARKGSNSVSDKGGARKRSKSKRKTNNDTPLSSFNCNTSPTSSDCEEEITHFSKYIAEKMKKYSETTKNSVQQAICELLFKADMAKDNFRSNFMEEQLPESDSNDPKPFDIKVSFSDSE